MAIELFTDNPSSRGISPRISFSHDLKNSEIIPIEPHIPLKSSLLDYDFNFNTTPTCYNNNYEPSLADELFANGIILPIQINTKNTTPIITKSKSFSPSSSNNSSLYLPPLPPHYSSTLHHKNEEIIIDENQGDKSTNNKSSSSFWKFKRSKSLNCGSIYTRGLCPIPLLSRSKSTGSSTSAKRSLISKDHESLNNNKHRIISPSSSTSFYQKPPLNKNIYGANSSGVFQVRSVINVPTGKVFGFGSIFSTSKDKTKKK